MFRLRIITFFNIKSTKLYVIHKNYAKIYLYNTILYSKKVIY